MTSHSLISNGSGVYCQKCKCSWDIDEEVDLFCEPEKNKAPRLIAFAGPARSGKDTAASVLLEVGFVKLRMADALKNMVRELLRYRGMSEIEIEDAIEGHDRERAMKQLNGASMRYALQTIGTEWGRNLIHHDLWLDAVMDRANVLMGEGKSVVISDIRFPNEAQRVLDLGGEVHIIRRKGLVPKPHLRQHASESYFNDLPCTGWIDNHHDTAVDFRAAMRHKFSL